MAIRQTIRPLRLMGGCAAVPSRGLISRAPFTAPDLAFLRHLLGPDEGVKQLVFILARSRFSLRFFSYRVAFCTLYLVAALRDRAVDSTEVGVCRVWQFRHSGAGRHYTTARSVELRASELAMILDGIDVSKLSACRATNAQIEAAKKKAAKKK